MKINISKTAFIFFCVLLFSSICFPQTKTIGKIFSKAEADSLFGKVIESVSISYCDLSSLLSKTEKCVMFQINSGELTILGDGRNVLYPTGKSVNADEVFALFSKSIAVELISSDCGNTVTVERRQDHITVTFGFNTLEESSLCPPICW